MDEEGAYLATNLKEHEENNPQSVRQNEVLVCSLLFWETETKWAIPYVISLLRQCIYKLNHGKKKKKVLGSKWKILEVSVMPKNQAHFNCSAVHKGSQLGPSSQFGAALPNQDSLWVGWERDPHWIVSAMAPTHEQQAPTTVPLGTSWLYKTASLLEAFKMSGSSSYSDFSHFLESQD